MKQNIEVIIIEDEMPAQELIKSYLKSHDDIEIIGVYDDGFDGLKAINELKPDLLFLDIQTPKLTGFEVLELIDIKPVIVFSTAYDEYAIKAFNNNAADYLLKPYSKKRFDEAVEKAREKLKLKAQNIEIPEDKEFTPERIERVVVKKKNKLEIIKLNELICLEADDDYVKIHSVKGDFLKNDTLKRYEGTIGDDFIRIHRSGIVNINFIDNISLMAKDSYEVILKDGKSLKVSKSGYKTLKDRLGL